MHILAIAELFVLFAKNAAVFMLIVYAYGELI